MELYPYEIAHLEKMRQIAPECMVLLKKNGQFPLENTGRIALYGNGARNTRKGGTGSGDVNSHFCVSVEQGLENAGFEITTKAWLDAYDQIYQDAQQRFVDSVKAKAEAMHIPALFLGMGAVMPEPEYENPLSESGDAAIYVLSRISGEGSDRKPIKGDILLTDTEVRDILTLSHKFRKFLLVLNVGGVVDLSAVAEVENILLLSQLGAVTGDALADVVLGKSTPSGKLTTTWTAWEDTCQIGDFGDENDTHYLEGIYVGYRYFDTVGKDVLFPFGFGLSYTDFRIETQKVQATGSAIELTVSVTNVGDHAGKETVQVYVSVPSGKLDQPYRVLAAFAKTDELHPGEEQILSLSFQMENLASFDTETACKLLEKGDYVLWVGNSSRNLTATAVVALRQTVVVQKLRNRCRGADFTDWKPTPFSVPIPADVPVIEMEKGVFSVLPERVYAENPEDMDIVKNLTDEELAYLCIGNFHSGAETKSFVGASGTRVAGSAGETTDRIDGIPCIVMADGPAGLRLQSHYGVDADGVYTTDDAIPAAMAQWVDERLLQVMGMSQVVSEKKRNGTIFDQYCTAIPIGTAIAQSWSVAVGEICGDVVGSEMERFGLQLWLAPAMNIHRDIRCGRNFEYASEDPLLSGMISAAITHGVQTHDGCGVTIKHFCCNNQETNRFRSNSIVSERALRDIYLKGFEICIQYAAPIALMTSYNLLNGVHTSERQDLLDGIVRNEWGYRGLIVSDWITKLSPTPKKYPYTSTWKSICAGNDLIMPGGEGDFNEILHALVSGALTREKLEQCATNVVKTVRKLKISANSKEK